MRARRERWRAELARAAPAAARALADALAGGHAVRGALAVAAEGGVPGRGRRASCARRPARWRSARGPRTSSSACARARGAPAWDTIVAAILLQRDAGGDLAGLLRSIAAGLEEAARVEADARSVTAQARFTAWLVALLPVGAAALAELADPGYVAALLRAPLAPWLLGGRGRLPARRRACSSTASRGWGRAGDAGAALLGRRPRRRCAAAGIVELAAAGVRTRPRRRAGAGARLPAALARLGRRIGVPAAPRDLARRLDAAGRRRR